MSGEILYGTSQFDGVDVRIRVGLGVPFASQLPRIKSGERLVQKLDSLHQKGNVGTSFGNEFIDMKPCTLLKCLEEEEVQKILEYPHAINDLYSTSVYRLNTCNLHANVLQVNFAQKKVAQLDPIVVHMNVRDVAVAPLQAGDAIMFDIEQTARGYRARNVVKCPDPMFPFGSILKEVFP